MRCNGLVLTVKRNHKAGSAMLVRKCAKVLGALRGTNAGRVPRWAVTGTVESNLAHGSIACDHERDIGARTARRAWIGQRAIAVGIHLAIDIVDVPTEEAAKICIRDGCRPGCCTLCGCARNIG